MKQVTPFHVIGAAEKLLERGVQVDQNVQTVVITLILRVELGSVWLRDGLAEALLPGHYLNDRVLLARFDSTRGGKIR